MAIGIMAALPAVAASAGMICDSPYTIGDELLLPINSDMYVEKEEDSFSLDAVTLKGEIKYDNGNTHPWGKQTNAIKIRWNPVEGAENFQVWVKGGDYKAWTKVKTTRGTSYAYTVTGLDRDTEYSFKVRATVPGYCGPFSSVQKLKTGRMDFDEAGWKAMCRIVYHEVGQCSGSMWDEPIVHVADCVVNQYEAAKYLNDPTWSPYYRRYDSVQSIIYTSGGFMSDRGLAADGATYARVDTRVKLAVYGAVYDKIKIGDIKHDRNVFFWCNRSYCPTGSKVAYTYRIPWGGYFAIWRQYWG